MGWRITLEWSSEEKKRHRERGKEGEGERGEGRGYKVVGDIRVEGGPRATKLTRMYVYES